MAALVLLFVGTHIGLTSRPVRASLVGSLGEGGFVILFSLVAAASFSLLIHYFTNHHLEGVAGLALGHRSARAGEVLEVAIFAGFALLGASQASYSGSATEVLAKRVRPPRGIERISRHPFFFGLGLVALAHVLLATRLVGAVLWGGIALLTFVGARHQDAKLLERRGEAYADYLAGTSFLPFAAVLAGRQQIVWREIPWLAAGLGLVLAAALLMVHEDIFAFGGALVIPAIVGGGAVALLQAARRARREEREPL
jgi:uncharacterized membrane protein